MLVLRHEYFMRHFIFIGHFIFHSHAFKELRLGGCHRFIATLLLSLPATEFRKSVNVIKVMDRGTREPVLEHSVILPTPEIQITRFSSSFSPVLANKIPQHRIALSMLRRLELYIWHCKRSRVK